MTGAIERRKCPVPGCGASLRLGHLLCKPCWAAVPRAEQAAVNQTWTILREAMRDTARTLDLAAYRDKVAKYTAASAAATASAQRARPS